MKNVDEGGVKKVDPITSISIHTSKVKDPRGPTASALSCREREGGGSNAHFKRLHFQTTNLRWWDSSGDQGHHFFSITKNGNVIFCTLHLVCDIYCSSTNLSRSEKMKRMIFLTANMYCMKEERVNTCYCTIMLRWGSVLRSSVTRCCPATIGAKRASTP